MEAQAILGLAHAQGLGGVAQDLALSKRWLRAAAKAGHAEARREWIEALANAWLRIQGKDRDSAAQLINQAVDLLLGA